MRPELAIDDKPACRTDQFLYHPVALMTPEEQARQRIDEMLTASGWVIQNYKALIRPSGNVEFLGSQLNKIKRPDRADDRSFYMNIALNALAKEGYELGAITSDDYVMKRRVK